MRRPHRRQCRPLLQEGSHDLGRHIFHGRKGELYRAYREGMEDQLGATGLAALVDVGEPLPALKRRASFSIK